MLQGLWGLMMKVYWVICKSLLEALDQWDAVVPQCRVLLSMCRMFHGARVQRTWHGQNSGHISQGWEPVLHVGSTTTCAHKHCAWNHRSSACGKIAETFEITRRMLPCWPACVSRLSQTELWLSCFAWSNFHVEQSIGKEVDVWESEAQNSCLSLWMMPRGGTVQTQLCQMQLWWRIRLMPEKCRLCRLKWILVRSKVAYQSAD